MMRTRPPSLAMERQLWDEGHDVVVGVDEVGRGAWAGPLSVGAAVLPRDRRVYKVRDSKALTEAEREKLFARVAAWCVTWAVGHATQAECDEIGMADAQRLAAQRAIEGLGVVPDAIVVDGKWDFVSRGADGEDPPHREGRCDVPHCVDSVGAREGDARSDDARRVRALPRLRLRREQGLPVPAAQSSPRCMGADFHPPPHLGVHGSPALAGDANPPAGAGTAVRSLTTSGARSRSRSRSGSSSIRAPRPTRAPCSRRGPSLRDRPRRWPRTRPCRRPTDR